MATGNVIGKIEVVIGNVKIISADGSVRDAMSDGFLYEGEQIISTDENALFQIKYLALPEETAYEGAFRVFADGSVIAGADAMENIASDKSLSDILATADETAADELETAAGEEGVLGSSSYTPYDVVAESSVLGFNRYPDTGVPLQGTVIDELADATGTNDAPTISVSGVNDLAYESGLATGSNADANTEFANGTFTISDPDGLHQITSVTINGTTIAIANLGNDNIINGTSGTLTITSYDSATGVATYQYELTSNTTDVEGVTETDTFTLTANDGTLDSAPATITIEIVDDMPTVVADNTTTAEDTTVIYNVITNTDGTSDSSGADTPATLIAAALADSSKGTVVFNPNGTVTFTPAEGVEGDVVVNYIIKDADGDTANSTLTINVGADSEPSFVNAANASVDETGGLHSDTQALTVDFGNDAGTLSLSAADADWNSTTNTLTANNGDWKIVVNDDNTYTVTQLQVMTHPNPLNPNDPVSVTITANADEVASTDHADTTFTVTFLDDGPTVVADNTTTAEDTTVIYNVITNTDGTSDSSGADTPATLIAAALADSSKGTVVFNPNGTVTFTPAEGVEGDVVVNYIIKDADGDTANSTLTINVGADSEPSFVNAANASVDETGGLHSDTQALTVDFGNDAGTLSLSAADADWNSTTNTLTANNGDWKIVVNDDNTYTVTQLQVMTHPNPLNPNDPVSVTITANADEVASTDHADTTFTVTFLDDGPTISATNAIGPVNQHDYIGGIDISGGADGVDSITISINGVSGVSGVKVGDDYVPFIFTDNGDGTGSGSFEYNGTHSFNLVINGNNTYTLHLEGDPTIIDIGSTESLSFDQKGSGPTATYEITYLDSESGRTFLATASAAPDTSIPLSLLSLNGDATPVSLSDGGINASASGFGISNNLLNSRYSAKDGYETESFIYNPENSAASITLDFSSFDANDVIYLKVDGKDSTDAAVTQNILINGSGEDFIWSGSAWTAIPGDTSFEYDSKGDIISYTVNADDLGWGTGYIDTMQVTAGFDGTNGTDLKVEFGFAAITTTTVTEEVEMSFTATVTDNDGDTDTVDFIVATDGDNNINGTIGDDYIAGTIGNDSLYGGDGNDTLVYDSADSVIDGGAGTDTLLVAAADTLDISNISAISHVEVIELGTGAKITDSSTTADGISIQDVIDITGGNELIINATNNDSGTVNINNAEFVQTGSNVDGYNIYTATATDGITTYTIHIDDAITVD